MHTIEENYIIFDRLKAGGELGLITLTVRLDGRGLIASSLEFQGLGENALPEGRYSLDFVNMEHRAAGEKRRFQAIAGGQNGIANDTRQEPT